MPTTLTQKRKSAKQNVEHTDKVGRDKDMDDLRSHPKAPKLILSK